MEKQYGDTKPADKPPVPLDEKLRQTLQLSAIPLLNVPPRRKAITLLSDILQDVGKLRDGALVTGGALYILGYVVWSFYASSNHIGLVSAFQSQYLIAGMFAIIPVLLGYFMIKSLNTIVRVVLNKRMEWFNPYARGWKGALREGIVSRAFLLLFIFGGVIIANSIFHLTLLARVIDALFPFVVVIPIRSDCVARSMSGARPTRQRWPSRSALCRSNGVIRRDRYYVFRFGVLLHIN